MIRILAIFWVLLLPCLSEARGRVEVGGAERGRVGATGGQHDEVETVSVVRV